MNILKPLIIVGSLALVSFPSLAYHGYDYRNTNNSQQQGNYQNGQQFHNNRPCDNNRHSNYSGRHHRMMQYSTSIQTTQPEEALKKIIADVPKGENGKQYKVRVSVIEITPDTSPKNQ